MMHTVPTIRARRRPRAVFLSLPLHQWLQVASERRRLAALDAAQLRDIGVPPDAAAREARRPFWDTARR